MIDFFGLGNAGANLLTGAPAPTSSFVVTDFRDDVALLKEWGSVHRRYFKWQSGWGDWHEVYSAKHPTQEDADAEAVKMAFQSGYRAPRWWEFWRAGEPALPSEGD